MGVAQPLHTMDAENQDYMMMGCGWLMDEVLFMGDTELGNVKNAEAAKRSIDHSKLWRDKYAGMKPW